MLPASGLSTMEATMESELLKICEAYCQAKYDMERMKWRYRAQLRNAIAEILPKMSPEMEKKLDKMPITWLEQTAHFYGLF